MPGEYRSLAVSGANISLPAELAESPIGRHSIHEAIQENATWEALTFAFLCGVSITVLLAGVLVYFR